MFNLEKDFPVVGSWDFGFGRFQFWLNISRIPRPRIFFLSERERGYRSECVSKPGFKYTIVNLGPNIYTEHVTTITNWKDTDGGGGLSGRTVKAPTRLVLALRIYA